MKSQSYPRRMAIALLKFAIRVAPRFARDWGRAMLAEIDRVGGDWDALVWALGGVAVLAKLTAKSVLSLPELSSAVQPAPERLAEEGPMQIPYERTRLIFVPGIAATVTVWLVQSALGLLNWTFPGAPGSVAAWIFRVHFPFTYVPLFIHWDLIVSFAVAGAISALYGALLNSSPKQRFIAALFPACWEILKWLWLLWFPMALWVDPAHPPYRFMSLGVPVSITYWFIHIVDPAAAAIGVLYIFNRWFYNRSAEA